MSKNLIGIDFGHGVIRAAEVSPAGKRRPTLHRYHEVAVPLDAIKEGVVTDRPVVVEALRRMWLDAGFSTKQVVIGMGSAQVLIREFVVPTMPIAHVRETLPFRVQDLLPLPVADAVLDFFPIEEVTVDDALQTRGLLVAATRESVLANAQAAEAAGLRVMDVDLIPFALSRVHLSVAGAGTKVLLHVGAVSTSIILAANGVPQFVRVLPTGGADVTAALTDGLGVSAARADELKRRIGLVADQYDPESALVAKIAADCTNELVHAVRSTIAFYSNAHPESMIDSVLLSGGGAQLRGLTGALSLGTDLPVSFDHVADRFAVGPEVDEAAFLAAGPSPAVALGLTMRSAA